MSLDFVHRNTTDRVNNQKLVNLPGENDFENCPSTA